MSYSPEDHANIRKRLDAIAQNINIPFDIAPEFVPKQSKELEIEQQNGIF